jgi:hypothetical protein
MKITIYGWSTRPSRIRWHTSVNHHLAHDTEAAGGSRENFLYEFKAGPVGGRLRRPSSAGTPDWSAKLLLVLVLVFPFLFSLRDPFDRPPFAVVAKSMPSLVLIHCSQKLT